MSLSACRQQSAYTFKRTTDKALMLNAVARDYCTGSLTLALQLDFTIIAYCLPGRSVSYFSLVCTSACRHLLYVPPLSIVAGIK